MLATHVNNGAELPVRRKHTGEAEPGENARPYYTLILGSTPAASECGEFSCSDEGDIETRDKVRSGVQGLKRAERGREGERERERDLENTRETSRGA